MANKFNLTAEINLRGPTNIKSVVSQIRKELGTVEANVEVKVNPTTAKNIGIITNRLKAMNDALTVARSSSDSLGLSLKNLSSALGGVNKTNTSVSVTTKNTASAMSSVSKAATVASSKMEEFGRQSALAVKRFAAFSFVTTGIYAVVNAVNQGLSSFIKFDRQLVRLQQITGSTKTQISILENTITDLAVNLGVSSQSLIEIADTLAQAGLTAQETKIALQALAKTELAPSFDDLAQTTEGAIAALRQFNLEVTDLEGALGSINAVAAAFAVESSDIITAIQRTGGVFAAASKGVSEGTDALNEFIAVFTSVRATTRESAETIATGLRTIFTRIQRADTINQLRQFGVELTDLEGKFVGPFEAVKRLSEGLSTLDPRDIRFSAIIEELGGFRQVGKVIPLIQQFATAQEALKVAQKGQGSLTDAQIKAQQALAIQISKVREEFLALIRDIGKSSSFQALSTIILGLASGFIKLVGAFKPVLPILAVLGAIKGVSAITKFASGFKGAFNAGGGAKAFGTTLGERATGTGDRDRSEVVSKASEATKLNTAALQSLTASIDSLQSTIKSSKGAIGINSGGKVSAFATGGVVPGTGNRDTVPAVLTPGEFVIRKKAVEKIGANNLAKMNKGGIVGYENGGTIEEQISKNFLKGKTYQFGLVGLRSGLSDKRQVSADMEDLVIPKDDEKGTPERNVKLFTGLLSRVAVDKNTNLDDVIETQLENSFRKAIQDTAGTLASKIGGSVTGSEPLTKQVLEGAGFASAIGFGLEAALGLIGAPFLEKTEKTKSIDFPMGLGAAASLFGNFPPNIPTDATRTIGGAGKGASQIKDQIQRFIGSVEGGEFTKAQKAAELKQLVIQEQQGSYLTPGGVLDSIIANWNADKVKTLSSSKEYADLEAAAPPIKIGDQEFKRGIKSAALSRRDTFAKIMRDTAIEQSVRNRMMDAVQEVLAEGQMAGGPVKLYHGTNSGPDDSVLKSFQEKGVLSTLAQGYGQGAGFYTWTDDSSAIKQAQQIAAGRIMTGAQGGGRPMIVELTEMLDPKNWDLDYEMQAAEVSDFIYKNFERLQPLLAKSQGIDLGGGFKDFALKQKYAEYMDESDKSMIRKLQLGFTEEGRPVERNIANVKGDTRTGEVIGKLIQALRIGDPSVTDQFEQEFFASLKPGQALKYVGSAPLKPSNIRLLARGGSTKDTVPALLTPGEFVVNKKAASRIGYGKLQQLNRADKIQGYNSGGIVGAQRFLFGGKPNPPAGSPPPSTKTPYVPPAPPPGLFDDFKISVELAAERAELFASKAQDAGLTINSYRKTLAASIAEESKKVKLSRDQAKVAARRIATDSAKTLSKFQGKDLAKEAQGDTKESKQLSMILDQLTSKFDEMGLSAEDLTKAGFNDTTQAAVFFATQMAETGESASSIIETNNELKEVFGKITTEAEATAVALEKVAEEAGMSADTLRSRVTNKDIQQEQFIRSTEGQRFGKLASMAPGLTQKFSKTGAGRALGAGADFISGKGGRASKLFAGAGGFTGIGAGLATGAETVKRLLPKDVAANPNVAGAIGAVGGVGTGAAVGAQLGSFAGPIGALIGGVGGAIIGGIQGFFNAKNQAILTNAIEKTAAAFGELDIAFKKLDTELNALNLNKAQQSFQNVIKAQADTRQMAMTGTSLTGSDAGSIGLMAAAGGGIGAAAGALIGSYLGGIFGGAAGTAALPGVGTAAGAVGGSAAGAGIGSMIGGAIGTVAGGAYGYFNRPSEAQRAEALEANIQNAQANQEQASRLAESSLKMMSAADIGTLLDDMNQGLGDSNILIQQYTAGLKDEEKEKAIALAQEQAFIKLRKQSGASNEQIEKELQTQREKSLQIGAESLKAEDAYLKKQALLLKVSKEVAVATESLVDVFKRVIANTERYGAELDQLKTDLDFSLGVLSGEGSSRDINRQNEQVLSNVSAFSLDEVKAAADEIAGVLGNTADARRLANTAVGEKLVTNQIPALLRAAVSTDTDAQKRALSSVQALLEQQDLAPELIKPLMKELGLKLQEGEGLSESELDSTIKTAFSGINAGSDALSAVAKKYNDTIQTAADLQNKYNRALSQASAYARKATTIRLQAEIDLAQALGKSPTLTQLNAPVNAEISSLSGNLQNLGLLGANQLTNPAAIGDAVSEAEKQATIRAEKEKSLRKDLGAVPEGKAGEDRRQQILNEQLKNQEELAAFNEAAKNGREALELVANSGDRAANALSKIQEQQARVEAFGDSLQQALTATPEELFKMNINTEALGRALGGDRGILRTGAGRRAAFAGLEQDRELMTKEQYTKLRAELLRQSLRATGRLTPEREAAIKQMEQGPGELDPNVIEYRKLVREQIEGNKALKKLEEQKATKILLAMDKLGILLSRDLPETLNRARREALADAQGVAPPPPPPPPIPATEESQTPSKKDNTGPAAARPAAAGGIPGDLMNLTNPMPPAAGGAPVAAGGAPVAAAAAADDKKRKRDTLQRGAKEAELLNAMAAGNDVSIARYLKETGTTAAQRLQDFRSGKFRYSGKAAEGLQAFNAKIAEQSKTGKTGLPYMGWRGAVDPKAKEFEVSAGAVTLMRSDHFGKGMAFLREKATSDAIQSKYNTGRRNMQSLRLNRREQAMRNMTKDQRERFLSRLPSGEAKTLRDREKERQQPALVAPRPPDPLRLPQAPVAPVGPVAPQPQAPVAPDQRPQAGGPMGNMGQPALSDDDKSNKFLQTLSKTMDQFGSYISKLEKLDLKFELVGNYKIDVNITGAAGLQALDQSMRTIATELINSKLNEEIGNLRSEINSSAGKQVVRPMGSRPQPQESAE